MTTTLTKMLRGDGMVAIFKFSVLLPTNCQGWGNGKSIWKLSYQLSVVIIISKLYRLLSKVTVGSQTNWVVIGLTPKVGMHLNFVAICSFVNPNLS